jgi:hypothetical protein
MTHLAIKGRIAPFQMEVMLSMLKSWDIDAEVKEIERPISHVNQQPSALPFSMGMWADYDVDDKTLRAKAWGTNKRATL